MLINGYGPTENTTFTCCHPVLEEVQPGTSVPIGRPIHHTTVYVLDPSGQPVPVGRKGELYTGGDGVALGYWRREIEAVLHSVRVAHNRLIGPTEWRAVDGIITIN